MICQNAYKWRNIWEKGWCINIFKTFLKKDVHLTMNDVAFKLLWRLCRFASLLRGMQYLAPSLLWCKKTEMLISSWGCRVCVLYSAVSVFWNWNLISSLRFNWNCHQGEVIYIRTLITSESRRLLQRWLATD